LAKIKKFLRVVVVTNSKRIHSKNRLFNGPLLTKKVTDCQRREVSTPVYAVIFLPYFECPYGAYIASNITSIEKKERRCRCPTGVERRQRDETEEGEERDAIPDLLLKHSDAILAIYV
jgi:hypothetical protein